MKLWANDSPFETKDVLRARGYRWDAQERAWNRELREPGLEAELAWLRNAVYRGRSVLVNLDVQDARGRYSGPHRRAAARQGLARHPDAQRHGAGDTAVPSAMPATSKPRRRSRMCLSIQSRAGRCRAPRSAAASRRCASAMRARACGTRSMTSAQRTLQQRQQRPLRHLQRAIAGGGIHGLEEPGDRPAARPASSRLARNAAAAASMARSCGAVAARAAPLGQRRFEQQQRVADLGDGDVVHGQRVLICATTAAVSGRETTMRLVPRRRASRPCDLQLAQRLAQRRARLTPSCAGERDFGGQRVAGGETAVADARAMLSATRR